jgi:hypothetical protein
MDKLKVQKVYPYFIHVPLFATFFGGDGIA